MKTIQEECLNMSQDKHDGIDEIKMKPVDCKL